MTISAIPEDNPDPTTIQRPSSDPVPRGLGNDQNWDKLIQKWREDWGNHGKTSSKIRKCRGQGHLGFALVAEMDAGKIYRKPLSIWWEKTMVSKFPVKIFPNTPIHWFGNPNKINNCPQFHIGPGTTVVAPSKDTAPEPVVKVRVEALGGHQACGKGWDAWEKHGEKRGNQWNYGKMLYRWFLRWLTLLINIAAWHHFGHFCHHKSAFYQWSIMNINEYMLGSTLHAWLSVVQGWPQHPKYEMWNG